MVNKDSSTTIGMFGPVAAGKSTILLALQHMIQNREEDILPNHPMQVQIDALDDNYDSYIIPPRLEGTQLPGIKSVDIRREPRDKHNYSQQISAFHHTIGLYDNAGALFSAGSQIEIQGRSIKRPEIFRDIDEEVLFAWDNLRKRAAGLVVLLDSSSVNESLADDAASVRPYADAAQDDTAFPAPSNPGEEPAPVESAFDDDPIRNYIREKRFFTRAEYARMVGRLADAQWMPAEVMLEDDFCIQRKVAICLSKIDQLDLDIRLGVDEIIRYEFGTEMERTVKKLRDYYGQDNVALFAISALGYDPDDGEPNYDPSDGWLKNKSVDSWRPQNVEQPFFWILEQLERDYLQLVSRKGGLLQQRLQKSRQIHYIPYRR